MLQKNVLDYLDSSAARFPHKLAFADEARSFTFGQLRACARGLGTALADLGPQHNRPVAVLVNHTAANLAAFFGVLEAGHFYVPLDLQMPLPRLRGILETLSPAALVYPAGEETLAQALEKLNAAATSAQHDLPQALQSTRDAMNNVSSVSLATKAVVERNAPLTQELRRLIQESAAAVRSLRAFMDVLERNPEALLRGKQGSRR